MRDSMTLNSYLEMKGYTCNTVQNVKKDWVQAHAHTPAHAPLV